MPLPHHCISCGTDLSWIRAAPDPHYGLPVVVCPSCLLACTRRKPPTKAAIRRFRLAIRTGLVLLVELVMLALLAGMSVTILRGLAEDSGSPGFAIDVLRYGLTNQPSERILGSGYDRDAEMLRTITVVLILVSVGAGVWIRSAHGHLRLWTSVICWFGLIIGLLGTGYTAEAFGRALSDKPLTHLTLSNEIGAAAIALLFTAPFVMVGLPLGARARKIWNRQHLTKAHKHRRKLRRHRMNHARPAHR